jgi:cell wall-associated NlpC family hydrolase
MLAGIRSEIRRIQAEEYRRSLAIARQVRAQPPVQGDPNSVIGAIGVTSDGSSVAPPARYGGVVGIAMRYLGIPYRWGGSSPSGFDCSGFVMYVFAQVGVSLPHNAAAQYAYGTPVSRDQLQPGDLVFFNGLGHNGIYIGGGNFIHSPHTGDVVKISSLTGWYASTWYGARRL